MRSCVAGLVQMRATGNLEENVRTALSLAEEAADRGAELVVLPEAFCGFGGAAQRRRWAFARSAPDANPVLGPLYALSRMFPHCFFVAGGIPERGIADRTHNTAWLVQNGQGLAGYRKIHLFDTALDGQGLRESDHTAPGDRPVVARTPLGGLGLSICYDLRFPELYRTLARAGAEILLVPSAFTQYTGMAHWEPLLRARAIENRAFVLAPAQWGDHGGGRRSYGHSLAVDPWGVVIGQASAGGDQVVLVHLRQEVLEQTRRQLPFLSRIDAIEDAFVVRIECGALS